MVYLLLEENGKPRFINRLQWSSPAYKDADVRIYKKDKDGFRAYDMFWKAWKKSQVPRKQNKRQPGRRHRYAPEPQLSEAAKKSAENFWRIARRGTRKLTTGLGRLDRQYA